MVKSHLFQKRVSVPYAAEVLSKCFRAKTEDSLTLDLSHPMIQLDPSAEKRFAPRSSVFFRVSDDRSEWLSPESGFTIIINTTT